jgi:hypothetical protein
MRLVDSRDRRARAVGVVGALAAGVVALTSSGAMAQPASETANLQASRDNTLYEDMFGSVSNGAGEYFFVGRTAAATLRRGVLAFDVANAVPAGSVITSVRLRLTMNRTAGSGAEVQLHRALQNWGEGTSDAFAEEGAGALSTPGDATWVHSSFDTTRWTTAGGDYEPGMLSSLIVGGNGSYFWESTPEFVQAAQSWLDSPANNYGMFLIGDEANDTTAKRFSTRESPDVDSRPELIVTYVIPGPGVAGVVVVAMMGIGMRRRRR